jgi:hypothetical protein
MREMAYAIGTMCVQDQRVKESQGPRAPLSLEDTSDEVEPMGSPVLKEAGHQGDDDPSPRASRDRNGSPSRSLGMASAAHARRNRRGVLKQTPRPAQGLEAQGFQASSGRAHADHMQRQPVSRGMGGWWMLWKSDLTHARQLQRSYANSLSWTGISSCLSSSQERSPRWSRPRLRIVWSSATSHRASSLCIECKPR